MKKASFRSMLLFGYCPEHCCQVVNPAYSETDPSLAMTGTDLAVASMLGQAIPQPSVNYSFNSATSPELVSDIDSVKADPFDIYAKAKQQKQNTDNVARDIQESSMYQEFINSNNKK